MESEINQSLDKIVESLKKLEISTKSIETFTSGIKNLNENLSVLITLSSNLDSKNVMDYFETFNTAMSSFEHVAHLGDTLQSLIGTLNLFSEEIGLATAMTKALSSILGFCASNPLIAVITAVGGAAFAFMALTYEEDESIKKSREYAQKQAEKREHIDKVTESLKENARATKENNEAINADYSFTLSQVDELVKMTGKDGYVKNVEEAKYLIDSINDVLPNTVELTKDNKIVWRDINGEVVKNIDVVKKSIDALKQRAIVEAYQKDYVEAIKNESTVTIEKIKAENALKEARERNLKLQQKKLELSDAEMREKGELCVSIEKYKEIISSCNEQLLVIQESENNLRAAQASLSGETKDLAQFMVEQYSMLGENGEATWDSLGAGLMSFDDKLLAHNSGVKQMSQEEVEATQVARNMIKDELIRKAQDYGMSYNLLIETLEDKGVFLREEEKELFKGSLKEFSKSELQKQRVKQESMDILNEINNSGLSALDENTMSMLQESIKYFAEAGDENGMELCRKLSKSLKDNKGEVDWEVLDLIDDIEDHARKSDPTLVINVDDDNALRKIKDAENKAAFNAIASLALNVTAGQKILSVAGKAFAITLRATGGFPDTGELFVAREAGPELVGRINGKTAVANNDQIVSGISSGVFNAVTSAMKGMNTNGHMNIHATFVMDGEVVGKQVIKYHNGVVNRTGRSPLMI